MGVWNWHGGLQVNGLCGAFSSPPRPLENFRPGPSRLTNEDVFGTNQQSGDVGLSLMPATLRGCCMSRPGEERARGRFGRHRVLPRPERPLC